MTEKVDRRRYVKYAGAGIVAVGVPAIVTYLFGRGPSDPTTTPYTSTNSKSTKEPTTSAIVSESTSKSTSTSIYTRTTTKARTSILKDDMIEVPLQNYEHELWPENKVDFGDGLFYWGEWFYDTLEIPIGSSGPPYVYVKHNGKTPGDKLYIFTDLVQAKKENDRIGFDVVFDTKGNGGQKPGNDDYRIAIDNKGIHVAQGNGRGWRWATKSWWPLKIDEDFYATEPFGASFRNQEEHQMSPIELDMGWLNKYEPEFVGFALAAKVNDEQWHFPQTEKIRQLPKALTINEILENPSLWGKMKFTDERFDSLITLSLE